MTVSIETIAEAAGFSAATISRAFDDARCGSVRPETRKRILEIADKLGYRPNPMARRLKMGIRDIVGMGVAQIASGNNDAVLLQIMSRFLPFINHVNRLLEEAGLHLMYGHMANVITKEKSQYLPSIITSGYCEHMIILSQMWPELACQLVRMNIRPIVIDGAAYGCHAIQRDEVAAMEQMVDYLVGLGHKRIAYISSMPREEEYRSHYREDRWPKGYLRAITRHRLVPMPGWDQFPVLGQMLDELLAMSDRPTSIIAYDEDDATFIIKTIRNLNIRVPEDISVSTLLKLVPLKFSGDEITCVTFPYEQAAKAAVDIILAERAGKKISPQIVNVNGKIVGNTTAPVKQND